MAQKTGNIFAETQLGVVYKILRQFFKADMYLEQGTYWTRYLFIFLHPLIDPRNAIVFQNRGVCFREIVYMVGMGRVKTRPEAFLANPTQPEHFFQEPE